MYDEKIITSILDKMEIRGSYRKYLLEIVKLLSNKIYDVLMNLKLESKKLHMAVMHLAERGKFIRGLYSYIVSRALGVSEEKALLLATSIELYHLASLIHDDIIDKADYRRGLESVHRKYGLEYAIIAGDTLIIYSNYILSKLGGEIIRILADSGLKLSDGEALELDTKVPESLPKYNRIVYLKTAAFFEGIFKSSAFLSGRMDLVNDLRDIGIYIGYSFQYKDDIFDYIGDPKVMGKPRGIDKNKSNLINVLVKQYGFSIEEAISEANKMIADYISKAVSIIRKLSIDAFYKDLLIELTRSLGVRIV